MGSVAKIIGSPAFRRFEELTVYFFAASLAGHFIELIWALVRYQRTDPAYILQAFYIVPLPLAEPYGFGAVAAALLVVPLMKKHPLNLAVVFVIGTVLAAVVEYSCAVVLALVFGQNYFWNYSAMPPNLQGYVCLETSLWFGALMTLFVYVIYPWAEHHLKRISARRMHILCGALYGVYALHFIRLALLG